MSKIIIANKYMIDLNDIMQYLEVSEASKKRIEYVAKTIKYLNNTDVSVNHLINEFLTYFNIDYTKIDFSETFTIGQVKSNLTINGELFLKQLSYDATLPAGDFHIIDKSNIVDGSKKQYLTSEMDYILNTLTKLKNSNHLVLKAPTGTGKTHLIIEMFKKSNFNKFIFITHTSANTKQTYYSCKDNGINAYFLMGDKNTEKNLINEIDNRLTVKQMLSRLLTNDKDFFIMDFNYYKMLFKQGKVIKNLTIDKDKILVIGDEFHELYYKYKDFDFESDNVKITKDNLSVQTVLFNCAYKNFKYLFLSATPPKNLNLSNVLDYTSEKTNIKNLHLINKKDFESLFLDIAKTGESVCYYAQNSTKLNDLKNQTNNFYRHRLNTIKYRNKYPTVVCTSKSSSDDKDFFNYLVINKDIKKYATFFTSAVSTGINFTNDIKHLFCDVSKLTKDTGLIQLMGRGRGTIENCYIVYKDDKVKEIKENKIIIDENFITFDARVENTNISLKSFSVPSESAYMKKNELLEYLKENKYILENIFIDNNLIESKFKKELNSKSIKEVITDYVNEKIFNENIHGGDISFNDYILNLEDIRIIFNNRYSKLITDKNKFNNRVLSKFNITTKELIECLDNKYPLDCWTDNFLNSIENKLLKTFEVGKEYELKKDLKCVFGSNTQKVLNFVTENYFTHLKRKNTYKFLTFKSLLKEKVKDKQLQGKVLNYITVNSNLLNECIAPVVVFKNKNKLEQVKNYDLTASTFDDKIIAYNKNKVVEYPKVNDSIIKNKTVFYGSDINLNHFINYLNNDKDLSLDIETKSNNKEIETTAKIDNKHIENMEKERLFQPFYSYVSNINFYNKTGAYMILLTIDNYKDIIKMLFENIKNKNIIIHNIDMEFKFFKYLNVLELLYLNNNNIDDTLLLYNNIKISTEANLKFLAFTHFKEVYAEKGDFYNKKYMFKDVYYTYYLYQIYKHRLNYEYQLKQTQGVSPYLVTIDFYRKVILTPINTNSSKLNLILNHLTNMINNQKLIITDYNTPQKLIQVVYKKYNFVLENTQKDYLKELLLSKDYTEVKEFLKFKLLERSYLNYLILTIKNYSPSYNSLNTFRFSTSKPNLQGITSKGSEIFSYDDLVKMGATDSELLEFKNNKLFPKSLTPKGLLLNRYECDFSQLETAVGGSVYNNLEDLKIINEGLDGHLDTFIKITSNKKYKNNYNEALKDYKNGVKEVKEGRQQAKGVKFGLNYLMGKKTLYNNLKSKNETITENDAENIFNNFYENSPSAKQIRMECETLSKDFKFMDSFLITTKFGRRRLFCHLWDKSFIATNLVNYNIQSTASDLTLISAVRFMNLGYNVNSIVHDAIYTDKKENLPILKQIMEATAKEFLSDVNIKSEVDYE